MGFSGVTRCRGPGLFVFELDDSSGELLPTPVDSGLDGSFRQIQTRGDLAIGEVLDVAHQDSGPEGVRQSEHSPAKQVSSVAPVQTRERVWTRGDRREIGGVDMTIDRFTLSPDAPVVVDAQVPTNADEPRLKVRALVERVQGSEDLQEDLLTEVFRLIVSADELVGNVEDASPVLLDDGVPRRLISTKTRLNELIRGARWGGRGVHGYADEMSLMDGTAES